MRIRPLERHEIASLWSLDRSERIEGLYVVRDGRLVLQRHREVARGWPEGERERTEPILVDCFDRGGFFEGAFEGKTLVGGAVLDVRRFGSRGDRVQLHFLYVSHGQRGRRIGRTLFENAARRARTFGARRLYVSATPTENTVRFYLRRGCRLADEVDPELFAHEPEDIHLELDLETSPRAARFGGLTRAGAQVSDAPSSRGRGSTGTEGDHASVRSMKPLFASV